MKSRKMILTILLNLFIFSLVSAQRGYIKIGDIKGESTRDHKDWIEVLSFHQGVNSEARTTGARMAANRVNFADLVVTKKLDKTSPGLMQKCANGEMIPEIVLDLTSNETKTFYTVSLSGVRITGISASTSCNPDCEVREEVSFNFSKIKWTYYDNNGNKTEAGYDVQQNRAF